MSFAYTAALVLVSVGVTVAVMSYLQSGGKNDPVQFAEKSDPAGTTSPTGGQDQATGAAATL